MNFSSIRKAVVGCAAIGALAFTVAAGPASAGLDTKELIINLAGLSNGAK